MYQFHAVKSKHLFTVHVVHGISAGIFSAGQGWNQYNVIMRCKAPDAKHQLQCAPGKNTGNCLYLQNWQKDSTFQWMPGIWFPCSTLYYLPYGSLSPQKFELLETKYCCQWSVNRAGQQGPSCVFEWWWGGGSTSVWVNWQSTLCANIFWMVIYMVFLV